jgi:biopolymer transport protein TolQ
MWGLFLQADLVVQLVMLLLLLASFWCWAIIFEKITRMRKLAEKADRFEETFWSGGSLDELYDRVSSRSDDPMTAIFTAAMKEWRRAPAKGAAGDDGGNMANMGSGGLADRIDRVMSITLGREMQHLERYMIFLASVGSTAPFVGLFGTVWGIMNSFQAIALTKNTSLAVVAPGIAEALFATALGLVAAIPAVIAYNKLSNDIGRYAGRLEAFSGEFSAILSRQAEARRS